MAAIGGNSVRESIHLGTFDRGIACHLFLRPEPARPLTNTV